MPYRPYVADNTIPGLAEVEVKRLAGRLEEAAGAPRGLSRQQLRDLGFDRNAA